MLSTRQSYDVIETYLRRFNYSIMRDEINNSSITLRQYVDNGWLFITTFTSKRALIDYINYTL